MRWQSRNEIVARQRNPSRRVPVVARRRHNYKHLFATKFSYYNYSHDLLDTAAYYLMFGRLMSLWRSLLPGAQRNAGGHASLTQRARVLASL